MHGDPAEEEGITGAENQARVDVGGSCDNAFVQQVPDLIRDRLEGLLADQIGRASCRERV